MTFHAIEFIETADSLSTVARAWRNRPILGMDTEFERTRTYHARLALIQVSDGEDGTLIDPLAVDDLSPVWQLLDDPDIEKVFHSGSEDMELLGRLSGKVPKNIFDTQIAAGLAGVGDSLSYGALVAEVCKVELSKSQTRSDWLQRPLTEAQLRYAVADVDHLLEVRSHLAQRLEDLGRTAWLREDCERMVRDAVTPADPDQLFMDFKHAWKLSPVERGVLRDLVAWREDHAREVDLPRRHVLDDDALLNLARNRPKDQRAVAREAGMGRRKARDIAARIVELIETAEARSDSEQPPEPPQPLPRTMRALMRRLRDVVQRKADELGIASNLLASKKDLIVIARDGKLGERLQGWRASVIGDELLKLREANSNDHAA